MAHTLRDGVGHHHLHPTVLPPPGPADVNVIPGQVHGPPHLHTQRPGMMHQATPGGAAAAAAQSHQQDKYPQVTTPPPGPGKAPRRFCSDHHGEDEDEDHRNPDP
ncbi:hypothetical protein ACOMHN_060751 [Nucella lapillus]